MENKQLKSLEIKTNPYEIKINGEVIDNKGTQSVKIELYPNVATVEIIKVDIYQMGENHMVFENQNPIEKSK